MRKTLSLHNMAHKCGAGLLISAYFVLAMVPMGILIPEMSSVQNVMIQECHKSCHVANGKQYCTSVCSMKNTYRTQYPVKPQSR
jgi:hypothetical protein